MIIKYKEYIGEKLHVFEINTNNVKDNCVECRKEIKNKFKNYKIRGNFCERCNARHNMAHHRMPNYQPKLKRKPINAI